MGRPGRWTLAILLLVGLAAWRLMAFSSTAENDDVRWILAAPVTILNSISDLAFEWEPGHGYLTRPTNITLNRSCSGLRFLSACLVLMALPGAWRARSARDALRTLALAGAGALTLSVLANTLRIGLAVPLAYVDLAGWELDFCQAHQLESRVVYALILGAQLVVTGWREQRRMRRTWAGAGLQGA